MGVSTLSGQLLKRLRERAPQTSRERRRAALFVRGLEKRIVLDATIAVGGGSVDISGLSAGTDINVTFETFDLGAGAEAVYRFDLSSGAWNDGVSNLVGPVNLNGTAAPEAVVDGTSLYVSAQFLQTNAGGLSVSSAFTDSSLLLATNITTVGHQDYLVHVQLQTDVLISSGAGSVTFGEGVTGAHGLSVHSIAITTFHGAVDLESLTTDAGGRTIFAAGVGTVTTSADQNYGDNVVQQGNLVMTAGVTRLAGGLIGRLSDLTINGDAELGDSASDLVARLSSLNITGNTTINAGIVMSTGAQTYGDDVTLGSTVELRATLVTINGDVSGAGHGFTISANAVLGDAPADSLTGLASLVVTGTTVLHAGEVTSTGDQTYQGTVTLAADVELKAAEVTFNGRVIGDGHSLFIDGDGVFGNGAGDTVTGLTLLDVTGAATINTTDISSTGSQTYAGPVTLGEDVTLTASLVTFQGPLIGGGHSLDVDGDAVFGDEAGDTVTGLLTLSVTGAAAINTTDISSTGSQTYAGPVTLGEDATLTASLVTFQGPVIGGGNSLEIDGDAVFGDEASDTVTGVNVLHVTGATVINTQTVSTTGTQTYEEAVTIGAPAGTTVLETTNDAVVFEKAVDLASNLTVQAGTAEVTFTGAVNGSNALIVNATGRTLFLGPVGGATPLTSLTTDAGGQTVFAAGVGTVTTSSDQSYGDQVELQGDLVMTAGVASLAGGLIGGTNDLTIQGDAELGDSAADTVSGLGVLSVTGDTTINAARVMSTGAQTYGGDVTLGATVELTASLVMINRDVIGGGNGLTINANAVLGEASTDSLTGLASLEVTGTTVLHAGEVTSTGNQTYQGTVTLANDAELNAAEVTFNNPLIGDGHSLDIDGDAVFGDEASDTVTGLSTLSVTGAATINTREVTSTGFQSYRGAVTIGAPAGLAILTTTNSPVIFGSATTLEADLTVRTGSGNITWAGAIDGGFDLVANSTGTTIFNGPVGGLTALASLTTNAGGATQINGGGVHTTGDQRYGDDVQIGPGTQSLSGDVIHFFGGVDGRLDRQGDLNITRADAVFFDKPIGAIRDPGSVKVSAVDITFADGTFIDVGKSAAESVHIVATGTLVLPTGFVVRAAFNAGDYDGVANTFLPRPSPGIPDTALVELPNARPIFSSRQNLDQTATGTIALTVGNTGERGLRVFVDWGDTVSQENRFEGPGGWADGDGQGDNNDPGDLYAIDGDSIVRLTHTYTAAEVRAQLLVDNTFDVQYAVFQHEAIVIEAARVEQGQQSLGTPGGATTVLTTTMDYRNPADPRFEPPDPLTVPSLVNGTAAIQIAPPAGSVPFEFSVDRPEVDIRPNNDLPPIDPLVTFQQVSKDDAASSSPVAGRQQRFVLRLLSPDPTAPPLAEVDLPADSFQADRLQRLFRELPDGAYEIDLLLGENTERPILRFDIRQGRPVVPQETLDGGQLKLEDIEETLKKNADPSASAVETAGDDVASTESMPEESEQADPDPVDSVENKSLDVRVPGTMSPLLEWKLRRLEAAREGSLTLAGRLARRVCSS